jgi:signal peptidase
MVLDENSLAGKIQYLTLFVTRAFFIAVFCLLFLLCLFLLIYYGDLVLNVKSGNYKSPLFNGYIIASKSMVPTIKVNDAIVVKRDNNDAYKVGDIISFFSSEYDENGMIITHRIVGKNHLSGDSSNYITKGDNNRLPDRMSVNTSNVYGKVLLVIPNLGKAQAFLAKPSHFLLTILVPALLIIVMDVFKIINSLKKSKLNC